MTTSNSIMRKHIYFGSTCGLDLTLVKRSNEECNITADTEVQAPVDERVDRKGNQAYNYEMFVDRAYAGYENFEKKLQWRFHHFEEYMPIIKINGRRKEVEDNVTGRRDDPTSTFLQCGINNPSIDPQNEQACQSTKYFKSADRNLKPLEGIRYRLVDQNTKGTTSDSSGIKANQLTREVLAGAFDEEDAQIKSYLNSFESKKEQIIVSQKPFSGWSFSDLLPQECRIN